MIFYFSGLKSDLAGPSSLPVSSSQSAGNKLRVFIFETVHLFSIHLIYIVKNELLFGLLWAHVQFKSTYLDKWRPFVRPFQLSLNVSSLAGVYLLLIQH